MENSKSPDLIQGFFDGIYGTMKKIKGVVVRSVITMDNDGQVICRNAIESVMHSEMAFCKFLSANDSGETGGHQVGVLVSRTCWPLMFDESDLNQHIAKRFVKILWQDGSETESAFTWYTSKGELRITRFGKGFEFLRKDQTGSLFIFTRQSWDHYTGFFLDDSESIDDFLDFFGIGPTETNAVIDTGKLSEERRKQFMLSGEKVTKVDHEQGILAMASRLTGADGNLFPGTTEMSQAAQELCRQFFPRDVRFIQSNPDAQLLKWTDEEYRLFRAVEMSAYGDRLRSGFSTLDDFISLANTVLNRRKSRAGKSLEHHLASLFDGNQLLYTPQAKTEGKKTPDFIFPSQEAYHNKAFPADRLISLAAKTTCKDRWRQVITEADRIPIHYLCTLQQGVSAAQMDEMESENVILVVPKAYHGSYPADHRSRIWTISKFIAYVKETEGVV